MKTWFIEFGPCGWGVDRHPKYPQWRRGFVAWGSGVGSMRARILSLEAEQERVLQVLKGEVTEP